MLPLLAAGATLAGSIYGANKQADAVKEANSGELPDWLKDYVLGSGPVPSHIAETPLINTNWMDYVMRLGQGDQSAQWNPMTADSPWFNPDQTFTPEPGGGPYGQLPPGMQQPAQPPVAQGPLFSQDQFQQAKLEARINGMLEGPDGPQANGGVMNGDPDLAALISLFRGQ